MSDNKKIFFLHLRPAYSGAAILDSRVSSLTPAKGGRTVAYTYDEKGVKFAVAKVNPSDVYDKSIGRKVATDRLSTEQAGYWPGDVESFRRAVTFGLTA